MSVKDNASGSLVVLSGPSGTGKTTVYKELLKQRPDIHFSVSCTTRAPRPGECNGVDYHFVSPAQFQGRVAVGGFLEHAEVHGNHYGTPRGEIEAMLGRGRDVLLDIDVQGARQVRASIVGTALAGLTVFVFFGPPSYAELERRLRLRGTDSEAVLQRRLVNARSELQAWPEYDYVVVNRTVAEAVCDLGAVIAAFRCRTTRFNGDIWAHD